MALRVFSFHLSVFCFLPFQTPCLQRPGEWFRNYLSVTRPQAGQITQPQSCAFLHGDDWMRLVLTGGLCRLTRRWSAKQYRTQLDPFRLA
ncbi:hypothetical protein AVEN_81318-1 [Araneus ventricosus]|uniref:Secreted protein n=1 Tax=Araneus ventricosus TaxID=182803 RepID=A0A4Y2B5P1_ARAVE|nr:hypothetical protein AVEN_81318-1 [Araneus ventricosus]